MLPIKALRQALLKAPLTSQHGPWARAIAFRHLLGPPPGATGAPQPLWGGASPINGARFTPKGSFDCIYLAWGPVTALAEVQAIAFLAGQTFHPLTPPWTLMSVDGVVSGVLDLTDAATVGLLGTNLQEITGSWVMAASPPTQTLGQAAYDDGNIVGIKYPSAKNLGGGVNLVVFPDRLPLTQTDVLEAFDPDGNLSQRIP